MATHLDENLAATRAQVLRVLLVDDDEDDVVLFRNLFSRIQKPKIDLTCVADYNRALKLMRDKSFDVHFVDYRLGAHSGLQLLSHALRDDPTRTFVLVTGCGNEAVAVETIRMGAADYLSKAEITKEELERTIDRCFETMHARTQRWQQRQMALFDGLTGVYRKEAFLRAAAERIEADVSYEGLWTMLFIDVDEFKLINDTRGHLQGDAVLSQVAASISAALRHADLVGRFGGDEFCVLTRGGTEESCIRVGERIRRSVRRRTAVTVSVGVASERAPQVDLANLISKSDVALFEAKRVGRDKVMFWGSYA